MLSAFAVMLMEARTRLLGLVAVVATSGLLAACQFPTPSKDYSCDGDEDCDPERVCSPTKYCVLRSSMEPDAGAGSDAAPTDGMPIDGDPFAATREACIAKGYALEATTGNYYRVVTGADDWTAAFNDCNDDVPSATHLLSLSTQTEVDYVKTLQDYWIGWIDRPVEGQWHILTDETTTINPMTYWGGGRPDGGGSENCAVWRTNVNGMDDVDCPGNHRYICECDGKAVTKPPI